MKTIFKTIIILFGIILTTSFSCKKTEINSSSSDSIIVLNQINAKIFKLVKSLDENNKPRDYNWAISTNTVYIDSLDTPIDDNILAPTNLLDEFKIPNLKVIISGKKNINKNHVLTSPDTRVGFGYSFEITDIKQKK